MQQQSTGLTANNDNSYTNCLNQAQRNVCHEVTDLLKVRFVGGSFNTAQVSIQLPRLCVICHLQIKNWSKKSIIFSKIIIKQRKRVNSKEKLLSESTTPPQSSV